MTALALGAVLAGPAVLAGAAPALARPAPVTAPAGAASAAGGPSAPAAAAPVTARCQAPFVPAYFWSGKIWRRAIASKPAPRDMILDVTGTGAGSAPEPHFQALVRRARARGIAILGYSSTENGGRSAAAVEADVRHYRAWYHVDGMFLDLVAGTARKLPYYRRLARYIRRDPAESAIWLNPGAFPVRGYLSAGDVVMVFEGSFASYRQFRPAGWARHYRAARFAHVIYATSRAQLSRAIRLTRSKHAGRVFITGRSGAPGTNPYGGLPGYWAREDTLLTAACPAASG
jgi:Spherulation-specific family 4